MFVHGLIGTLQLPQLGAALAPRAASAPDLLGYGQLRDVDPSTITLAGQAARVRGVLAEGFDRPAVLVGHSVGGVIAALVADRHPDLVAGLVSVEGNFTLRDAFWSASVARMTPSEVEAMLEGWRADPATWLARSGIAATQGTLAAARAQLERQPATTVHATARSVVEVTGDRAYMALLRRVFTRLPAHLVAGARSRDAWDVPAWALAGAATMTVVPGRGHLMPLEDPGAFGQLVRRLLAAA